MSTISSLSSVTPFPPTNAQNSMQQNFRTLTDALQSGNLAAAQQAYATISQNAPAGAQGSSQANASNPMQQAMSAIGTALSSGDMSGAQSAMQSLQQGMKAHHGHHHRGAQPAQDSSSPASDPSASPQDDSGTTPAPSGAVDVTA